MFFIAVVVSPAVFRFWGRNEERKKMVKARCWYPSHISQNVAISSSHDLHVEHLTYSICRRVWLTWPHVEHLTCTACRNLTAHMTTCGMPYSTACRESHWPQGWSLAGFFSVGQIGCPRRSNISIFLPFQVLLRCNFWPAKAHHSEGRVSSQISMSRSLSHQSTLQYGGVHLSPYLG